MGPAPLRWFKKTRGFGKKVAKTKKRKADIAVAEEGSGGSAGAERFADVKATLEAAKGKAKRAAREKAPAICES